MRMPLQFAWTGRGGSGHRVTRWVAAVVVLAAVAPPTTARAADPPKHSYLSDEKGESPVEAYELGVVRLEIGDLKGAEASFRRSLELGGSSASTSRRRTRGWPGSISRWTS